MCTYTLKIDDKLVSRVKPAFKNEKAFQKWLQSQVEVLFIQYATNIDKKDKTQKKLSERLRGIGVAPQGFDYKKELLNRFK